MQVTSPKALAALLASATSPPGHFMAPNEAVRQALQEMIGHVKARVEAAAGSSSSAAAAPADPAASSAASATAPSRAATAVAGTSASPTATAHQQLQPAPGGASREDPTTNAAVLGLGSAAAAAEAASGSLSQILLAVERRACCLAGMDDGLSLLELVGPEPELASLLDDLLLRCVSEAALGGRADQEQGQEQGQGLEQGQGQDGQDGKGRVEAGQPSGDQADHHVKNGDTSVPLAGPSLVEQALLSALAHVPPPLPQGASAPMSPPQGPPPCLDVSLLLPPLLHYLAALEGTTRATLVAAAEGGGWQPAAAATAATASLRGGPVRPAGVGLRGGGPGWSLLEYLGGGPVAVLEGHPHLHPGSREGPGSWSLTGSAPRPSSAVLTLLGRQLDSLLLSVLTPRSGAADAPPPLLPLSQLQAFCKQALHCCNDGSAAAPSPAAVAGRDSCCVDGGDAEAEEVVAAAACRQFGVPDFACLGHGPVRVVLEAVAACGGLLPGCSMAVPTDRPLHSTTAATAYSGQQPHPFYAQALTVGGGVGGEEEGGGGREGKGAWQTKQNPKALKNLEGCIKKSKDPKNTKTLKLPQTLKPLNGCRKRPSRFLTPALHPPLHAGLPTWFNPYPTPTY